MFERLGEELREALPDEHLGYDGKAIESHSTGRESQHRRALGPRCWGRHETHGVDAKTGTPWTKVKTWFGYGLHLVADTRYEVPVDYRVTPASHSEVKELEAMVEEGFENSPALARRCRDLCADLDSGPLKAKLWDGYRVRPLIEPRELWREEKAMPDYDPTRPNPALVPRARGHHRAHRKGPGAVPIARCATSVEPSHTLKYRCPVLAILSIRPSSNGHRGVRANVPAGTSGSMEVSCALTSIQHDRRPPRL